MDVTNFRQFGKKIICIGRNYKALAAEQGNPIPESPIVFLKPTTAYIEEGEAIKIPPACKDFLHEVELGVVIGTNAKDISEDHALDCVAGYALCLDMTAWDFQCKAKADGQPWALAKGFDTACPVSKFIPKEKIPDTNNARLWLKVNGSKKQDSSTSDMIFTVPKILSYLSQYFTLEPGDIILTGSPAGAGPVSRGDVIEAGLEAEGKKLITMTFDVK
ncbi:acylpyruvase FAHD1, mitochondrial-like isoform X2 [Mercenaria mercenaria]|uniref:acylpyruvase FAHD1, mitochondrial-like isoform X2 n=1 Tax=Mercenaria mercenaria TaxID=6596 RepID=UPI00234E3AB8|nr:acylpyruvase FAHD1, mitochondrial-like isoform X2 [Mercenaria mercenaria]